MSKIVKFENYDNNSYETSNKDYTEIINRLESPEIAYMELKVSKFNCGACYFIENGYCKNKKVQSKVSLDGCCNLYIPKNKDEVDSANWHIK